MSQKVEEQNVDELRKEREEIMREINFYNDQIRNRWLKLSFIQEKIEVAERDSYAWEREMPCDWEDFSICH